METQLAEKLAQFGVLGLLLGIFVALFVWMFKTLFAKFLQHLDVLTTTQQQIATALEVLNQTQGDNHRELRDDAARNHIEILNQLARH